jgi:alpha-N-acetylglucosamine transferase
MPVTPGMTTSYIFMITRSANPDYVWGAAVAATCLRKMSDRQIHFLVTQEVRAEARHLLSQVGDGLIDRPLIQHPSMDNARFRDNYTKLHLFNLVEFERIVYLDADVLPLLGMDDLFDLPGPLAAAFDHGRGVSDYFNAGVLSLRPDARVFDQLMEAFRRNPRDCGCAEQDFLNWWFGPKLFGLRPAGMLRPLRRAGTRSWQAIGYEYNAIHLADRIADGYDPAGVRLVHEKVWEPHGLPQFEQQWQQAKAELVSDLASRGASYQVGCW